MSAERFDVFVRDWWRDAEPHDGASDAPRGGIMTPILILGNGGHGRVVASCLTGPHIFSTSSDPSLAATIGELGITRFIVAIGDNFTREKVAREILVQFPCLRAVAVIHPSVRGCWAQVAPGAVVMAGAIIQPQAQIGTGCIVNTGATVDHDCTLHPYCSVAPGAHLGGSVIVGARAAIGIGASIKHGVTIGEDAVIGAGSVVVRDIPPRVVAYGVPCRVVRAREAGARYL